MAPRRHLRATPIEHRVCHSANSPAILRVQFDRRCTKAAIDKS
jgi:hypothetical protein